MFANLRGDSSFWLFPCKLRDSYSLVLIILAVTLDSEGSVLRRGLSALEHCLGRDFAVSPSYKA